MSIDVWLRSLGLGHHTKAFHDNAIDVDILGDLTERDLGDLGIPLGDRKRIMRAIGTPPATQPPEQAERRHLTVMFVDLVGSTRIASEVDPEEVRDLIRAFQNAVAGEVLRFEGYVAKFMGDGVLCYFGFPSAGEDDAERAVRAGRAIVKATSQIGTASGAPALVRIGIATGVVVVGEMVGDAEARERDVVGQTPNLAARLQSIAEPGQIVVADETRQLVQHVFELGEVALPDLKGIAPGLRAFEVVGNIEAKAPFGDNVTARKAPIFGRDDELGHLRRQWDAAGQGDAKALLLTGEPGIGKSRLVHALYDHVGETGHARVALFCSPHHRQTALYPIISRIEKDAGLTPELPDTLAFEKLKALLPGTFEKSANNGRIFANLLGRDFDAHLGPLEIAPQQMRKRTIELLSDYLMRRARDAPGLVVVDDIQWIDETTFEVLKACISSPASHKMLFLFSGRSGVRPVIFDDLISEHIALARLDGGCARDIICTLARGKSVPEQLIEEILRKTDGVPLFVQELTKMILDSDAVLESDSAFRLTAPIGSLSIPSSLHDSLMARLDRLKHAKKTAQIAACIGRVFDFDTLSDLAPLERSEVRDALEELVEAELVESPDSATGHYSFCHALVCDAAYESLLKSQRKTIHASLARVLQENGAAPETLARHHEAAGQAAMAAQSLLAAGRSALRISAAAEAIDRFRKGLDLLAGEPSTNDTKLLQMRLWGLLGTGYMLSRSWGAPEVDQAFSEALKLVDQTDNASERIWVLWGAWVYEQVRGQIGTCQSKARRAMEIALEGQDDDAMLVAHVMAVQAAFYEGRWRDAIDHGAQIEALYDPKRHAALRDTYSLDLLVVWYVHGSQAHWMLGDLARANALREKARKFSVEIDHTYSRVWVTVWAANLDLLNGEVGEVLTHVPKAVELSDTQGFEYITRLGQLLLSAADGDGARAQQALDRSIHGFKETGAGITIPYFLTLKAQALLAAKQPDAAYTTCKEALALIDRHGEAWVAPLAFRILGDILRDPSIGDIAESANAYSKAADVARASGAIIWQVQAELGRLALDQQPHDRKIGQAHLDDYRDLLEGLNLVGPSTTIKSLITELQRF
ncbi:adenylate/guanylate cyclase domain-containing protein [Sulfitobacter sp. S190]|uniref:adenylate/guanylate cyclase domain-containing protein n=1 Tax=Sulfitobacter sp. S190 TaxID=2867022 RepID=UPI0021A5C517|nr:adenylate/guanylate cyclase domain-containing protein [Sulfitobacter sp. S190]UWR23900.1 AAA family ATPase [Sulfitobacter sp. S190]